MYFHARREIGKREGDECYHIQISMRITFAAKIFPGRLMTDRFQNTAPYTGFSA